MNRSFANTGGCRSCGMGGYTQSGGCGYTSQTAGPSLAIAYVPSQTFGELYTSSEALGRGTLFKELYMPYGGGSKCGRI